MHEAMDSLKPQAVQRKERRRQGKRRRRSDVYIRQGEWFLHSRAPMRASLRAGLCATLRSCVVPAARPTSAKRCSWTASPSTLCERYPKLAFFESEYKEILKTRRKAKQWKWRRLRLDPDIYVRGWIRHPDHNPLHLDGWHFVQMNTERQGSSLVRVVYRD